MSLAKYAKDCSKSSKAGNKLVAIAEVGNVTAITETAGEISAITGAVAFKEIDADRKTIQRTSAGTGGDGVLSQNPHVVFDCQLPTVELNTLEQSFNASLNCGLLILVADNNGIVWLVGYNTEDKKEAPIDKLDVTLDSGVKNSDAGMNRKHFDFSCESSDIAMPLDATLSASVLDGSATFVDYN